MMSKRRDVLKRVAQTSILSAGGVPATVVASNGSDGPNTNFNPDNDTQVDRFVDEWLELPESEALDMFKSLAEDQQRAVSRAMTPVSFEVQTEPAAGTLSTDSKTVFKSVTAYSDSGNKAYTYQHMLTWEWDTDPENAVVVDGDADAGAIYTSPIHRYKGESSETFNISEDKATSLKTGKFTQGVYVPTYVVVQTFYPYIDMYGFHGGSYSSFSDDGT